MKLLGEGEVEANIYLTIVANQSQVTAPSAKHRDESRDMK